MRFILWIPLAACAGSGPASGNLPDRAPFQVRLINVGTDGSGSGEPCEFVEESCPTDCDGNTPPWLGEPVIVVDGFTGETEIPLGATVQVAFPYRDDDDNLRCGSYVSSFATPENQAQGDAGGTLCSNQPASSEVSGFYVGWTFTVTEEGVARSSLQLDDACGASSDRWAWEATVPTPEGETIPAPVLERAGD